MGISKILAAHDREGEGFPVGPIESLPPMHPGEYLREEYLKPLRMSSVTLAALCMVPPSRVERTMAGTLDITGDMAVRLSLVLWTTAEFWLNLQNRYDLEKARRSVDMSKVIALDRDILRGLHPAPTMAGRANGGFDAAAKMTPGERSERARRGAEARWGKK